MICQTVALDFVLHPLIMAVLEGSRLSEFRKSERHHNPLCLVQGVVRKVGRPGNALNEQRSARGMLEQNEAAIVERFPTLRHDELEPVATDRRGGSRRLNRL